MSTELYWLTLTLLLTAVLWVPYVLNRFATVGVVASVVPPTTDLSPTADWAKRMGLAHKNAIENLVVFTGLVLVVHVTGRGDAVTAMASQIYFFARATHFVAFTFAIPVLRTVSFLVGFGCQLALATRLL